MTRGAPVPSADGADEAGIDGRSVMVRPIESTDGELLIRFHEALSSETIRMRFFGAHPRLSASQTRFFTNVDHRDREALVAVVSDEIVAVGRYERRADRDDAEVAFVVADHWQGMGVAPRLLALLVAQARQVGITRFVAETLEENRPMIDVFRHSGLSMTTSTSYGVLQVSMSLAPVVDDEQEPDIEQRPREVHGTVDLYWIPLGADAHVVRLSGKAFEAVSAFLQRRDRRDLYHSALEVAVPEGRYVIEQAPVLDDQGAQRGVVTEGAVGTRWARHFRLFRYEIRCWSEGQIPDARAAVESPIRLSEDVALARRVLEVLPAVPTPTWGRDELATGEMWNSNSVTSWVLARSGLDVTNVSPPSHGRAPGWHAGLVAAARAQTER